MNVSAHSSLAANTPVVPMSVTRVRHEARRQRDNFRADPSTGGANRTISTISRVYAWYPCRSIYSLISPARLANCRSRSTKGTPRRSARRAPIVLLPAPPGPSGESWDGPRLTQRHFKIRDDEILCQRLRRLKHASARIDDAGRSVRHQAIGATGDISTDNGHAVLYRERDVDSPRVCSNVGPLRRKVVVRRYEQRCRAFFSHRSRRVG